MDVEVDGGQSKEFKTSKGSTLSQWLNATGISAGSLIIALLICSFSLTIVLTQQYALCSKTNFHTQDVDVESCTCSCWDGKFKGCYPRHSHYGREYRHIYFNLTQGSQQLFSISLVFFVLLTLAIKQLIVLILTKRKYVSLPLVVAVVATAYPNFYGYWMFFNYINDGIVHLWATQLFFSLTEIINSTCLFVALDLSISKPYVIELALSWTPITISVSHLLISFQNFVVNWQKSRTDLALRDTSFLSCDVIVIVCCGIRLIQLYRSSVLHIRWRDHFCFAVVGVVVLLLFFFQGISAAY